MVPEPRLGDRPGGRPSPLRLPSRIRVVAADGDDEVGASGGLWGWGADGDGSSFSLRPASVGQSRRGWAETSPCVPLACFTAVVSSLAIKRFY